MNVCYLLEASDKFHCQMNSDFVSSLYTPPRCFGRLTELFAESSLSRLTFAGKVVHSLVCILPW